MFNRRDLLIGPFLVMTLRSGKTSSSQEESGLGEFVLDENAKPVRPEVLRRVGWCRAGLITVFSPDGKHVCTADRDDDFAQIWNVERHAEVKVLHPFKVEWGGDWVSYSDDGSEILVTAENGTVRRFDAVARASP